MSAVIGIHANYHSAYRRTSTIRKYSIINLVSNKTLGDYYDALRKTSYAMDQQLPKGRAIPPPEFSGAITKLDIDPIRR